MAYIIYLGSSIEEYRKDALHRLTALDICCPIHGHKMAVHGHYKRYIKDLGESIQVYRVICHECGKTHSVLPDFLQPYKQYSANVIEDVFNGVPNTPSDSTKTKASTNTRRRWLKTLGGSVTAWISLLSALLIEKSGYMVSLVTLSGLSPINQIREIALCLPAIKHSGNMLGIACMYLGCYYMAF